MKIFFMCAAMTSGGAERVISILANNLVEEGHDIEIITYFDMPIWYEINPKVKIVVEENELNRKGKKLLSHIIWKRNYIKEHKPDVIISFLASFNMLNIIASYGTNIPIIVADRSDPRFAPNNKFIRGLRNFSYRYADKIVLQSDHNKEYFSDKIKRKSVIIMNPILKSPMYQRALLTPKKNKIVSVGRIVAEKNPKMAVNSFREFHKKHPDYIYEIYGEGNLKNEMIEYVNSIGMSNSIFYKGNVKNVYEHIIDAKAYLLTSNYEGMPNSLIEAMYVGLPVISTKVSGAIDLIKDNENGYLVNCEDYKLMAHYLEEIVESDASEYRVGQNASKTVKKLELENIIEQWKSIIE